MSFTLDLMPLVTYLAAMIGIGALVFAGTAIAAAIPVVRRNHSLRIARHESIPAFYRNAITGRHAFSH